jgi:hypothetical protein
MYPETDEGELVQRHGIQSALLVPDPKPLGRFNPAVTVLAATPEDTSAIIEVFQSAFGASALGGPDIIERYLAWAYDDNPQRDARSPSHRIGVLDGKVVAAISRLHVTVLINGTRVPASWGQNDAVRSEFQRMQIGSAMGNVAWSDANLTMGAGRSSAGKAKSRSRGVQTFLDVTPFVSRKLGKSGQLRGVLRQCRRGQFRDGARVLAALLRTTISGARTARGATVTCVAFFDAEVDKFFASLAKVIPVMVERTSATLNWFLGNPRLQIQSFLARRNGEICGYALVRRDGLILDLLVHPEDADAFDALVEEVVRWCAERSVTELSGIAPRIPALGELYARAGFMVQPEVDFMFGYRWMFSEGDPAIQNPRNWYLSMADSDLWSFRLKK